MDSAYDNQGFQQSPASSQQSLPEEDNNDKIVVIEDIVSNLAQKVHEPERIYSKNNEIAEVMEATQIMTDDDKLTLAKTEGSAVSVRNAYKSYQKGTPVLEDFNMTVPKGTIYSLLGSSGCGKTTLLSCCVGIQNLEQGEILVFGHKPGTKESGIPGRRLGYMPQELSLYNELTIQEALNFYGRIYGMTRREMFDSSRFLLDFLDLPKASRRIGSLSGGQKRRVSLAIALLHGPELLILDEPTVGVDPLLRESIWGHLVKLVSSGKTTVIITTHYVEEARQSDVVGIMRNGRLLAEQAPDKLLSDFNVNRLEDLVLTLCRMDREDKKKDRDEGQTVEESKTLSFSLTSFLRRRSITTADCESSKVVTGNTEGVGYEPSICTGKKVSGNNLEETVFVETTNAVLPSNNGGIKRVSVPDCSKMTASTKNKIGSDLMNGLALKNGNGLIPGFSNQLELSSPDISFPKCPSTLNRRLAALLIKNFIILMRNIGFLMFIFIVPATQVVLICLTIGADPKGLTISVVNPENCDFEGPNWRNISKTCPTPKRTLNESSIGPPEGNLSCFYLSLLPKQTFILEREASEEDALNRIQNGYTYGYVRFPKDYTDNVMCRYGSNPQACTKTIDEIWSGSNIIIDLDMSNKQIGQTMKRIFVETYTDALDKLKSNCLPSMQNDDTVDMFGDVPYTFKKPVYGRDDTSFREFLAPSILLGLLFFFPLCSSGVSYITEKKTGTLDRALVAGVGAAELMGGFLISQTGILLGQAGFAFLILTQVFHIQILGSVSLALSLTILVGISGMSAGFLMAMFCTEEVHAVLLAIGTFFPNILLAGMVWPLEGMEGGLQYISYLLPCTLACESMRSIISRGWPIMHRSVWPGFVSTVIWIMVYWGLAILLHRIKRKM